MVRQTNLISIVILLTAVSEAAPYTHPSKPDVCHFQGTLHDLFEITTAFPAERCPPLNAISVRGHSIELLHVSIPILYLDLYLLTFPHHPKSLAF